MIIIGVESQVHIDYGLSYPITYELTIPENNENLKAYKKFQSGQNWESIEKIIEKPIYHDRIVEVEKIVERIVEKIVIKHVEVPVETVRVVEIEKIVEKPII